MKSTSSEIPPLFQDAPWLGFPHDGYPVLPLRQYRQIRGVEMPREFNREHISILQSLLSFGLLEAVTGLQISENDLLRDSVDGRRTLSVENIPRILTSWTSQDRVESEALSSERSRVEEILKQANKILSYLSESSVFGYPAAEQDNIPATFCTLGCIGESLTNARLCLYLGDDDCPAEALNWNFTVAIHGKRLLADACTSGWCASMVNYVSAQGNLTSARYAFRLGRARKSDDHRQCSVSSCKLTNVDLATYTPQHHVRACDCLYTKPPLDDVILAIERGVNPVMQLPKVQDRSGRLSVSLASDTPYIAISHVWADGLGSNTETGLPTCQAWKAAAFASAFVQSGAFWLDSLCVPKMPEVRRKALRLMAAAYRDAEYVIVLDKTIQVVSTEAPKEEILCRILTSPWMRRLWTLQEAVLAKKIVFQLSDGLFPLVSLDALIPGAQELQTNALISGLSLEIHRLIKFQRTQSLSLGDVARSLKWRSTNRAADELPAAMSLLPVNFQKIMDVPEERRMSMLLSEIRDVPRNIPFLDGPKLELPGFRWAPSTFMTISAGAAKGLGGGLELTTSSSTAQVTPRGLVAEYLVYEIAPRSFKTSDCWTLVDCDNENQYHISAASETAEDTYHCQFLLFHGPVLPLGIEVCLAVLEDVASDRATDRSTINCIYGMRLLVNGQRPDVSLPEKVISKGGSCLKCVRIS